MAAAPGSSASMPLTLRVIIGRFCSSVVWIVDATFDCVASIIGASPVTVSVSLSDAIVILKLSVIVAFTASVTRSRAAGEKPVSSVFTS